jgi:dienelactone hydrolase
MHTAESRTASKLLRGPLRGPHRGPRPGQLLRLAPGAAALLAVAVWTATPALAQAAGEAATAGRIVIEPAPPLLTGEPVSIRFEGLPPGAEVLLRAERVVRDFFGPRLYRSEARFSAGAAGRIDLATATPLPGGAWSGADVRGAFWSMVPTGPAPTGPAAEGPAAEGPAAKGRAPGEVRMQLWHGQGMKLLAERTIELRAALPAVVQRPADPAFPGAVFAIAPVAGVGAGAPAAPRPALILLGGSEGGSLVTRDAGVYASRGFAVLALPYYSPPAWDTANNRPGAQELPGLPAAFADIPVERLEAARDWLAKQPGVDTSRLGVVGTSKGAEFALLACTKMPWITSVVAIVPSDVVWEGWGPGVEPGRRSSFAWRGEAFAFVPYQGFAEEFAKFATGGPVRIRVPQDAGRAAHPDRVPAARIPAERCAAPVLVAGAHDDQIWDSGGMAESIVRSRAAAGRETVALVFRDAGHYLGGTGFAPTTQYNAGPMKPGGAPAADARAQAEVFAAQMAFLRRTLGPVPAVPASP